MTKTDKKFLRYISEGSSSGEISLFIEMLPWISEKKKEMVWHQIKKERDKINFRCKRTIDRLRGEKLATT